MVTIIHDGDSITELPNLGSLIFTSDTHFGSQRALELSKRPFSTVEEMDEYMIKMWNEIVDESDTVIHLGDFGEFSVRPRLNGRIILIQGNYEDQITDNVISEKLQDGDIYITGTFDNHAHLSFEYNDSTYYLTHRPIDCNKNIDPNNYFNLFGHIHGRQFIKKFGIDVGVDSFHFKPFTWDDILFFKNAIAKGYYDENVFC